MVQVLTSDPKIFESADTFRAELEKANKPDMQLHDTHQQFPSEQEMIPEVHTEHNEETHSRDQDENHSTSHEEPQDIPETKSHLIPKSRLDKEIEKRRTIEQELQTQREEKIRYQTQIEMIQAMQRQQQEAQPKVEQPRLDPLDPDAFNYQNQRFEELNQKLEQASQQSHMQQLAQQVSMKEYEFSNRTPDYNDAVNYVKDLQMRVARDTYGNDQDAFAKVSNDMREIVLNSIKNGKNPAENIYNMAKQYGYKAPQKTSRVDLAAVERNSDASANTSGLNSNVGIGSGPIDITQAFDSHKRVDPVKFAELLQRAQKQTRSGY